MPDTRLKIEIDGDTVAADDLQQLHDIQVEEAVDQADAATLVARLEPGDDGEWKSLLDPLVAPQTKLVVEVTRGDVAYRFDGLSTDASWDLDAGLRETYAWYAARAAG